MPRPTDRGYVASGLAKSEFDATFLRVLLAACYVKHWATDVYHITSGHHLLKQRDLRIDVIRERTHSGCEHEIS